MKITAAIRVELDHMNGASITLGADRCLHFRGFPGMDGKFTLTANQSDEVNTTIGYLMSERTRQLDIEDKARVRKSNEYGRTAK